MHEAVKEVKPVDRAEWLAVRRTGIGGSDVSAILGMNPWRSPVDVYLDKTGQSPEIEQSERMYWGNQLEDLVAREFASRNQVRVERVNAILRHPKHACMLGNIDRAVSALDSKPQAFGRLTTDTILECKTTSAYSVNDWGATDTDEIPEYYLCQCLHYLAVTGCDICRVAVLLGGQEFRQYTVQRNNDVIDGLVEACLRFWSDHVEAHVPPAPRSVADVQRMFPRSASRKILCPVDIEAKVRELQRVKYTASILKATEDELKDQICVAMVDADALELPDGSVIATWKSNKDSVVTNWEAAAKAAGATPEIIKAHTTSKPGSRPLSLKIKTAL